MQGKIQASISSGISHSVAVDLQGEVFTSGNNNYGQLSASMHITGTTKPYKVSGIKGKMISVKAGFNHNVALSESGDIWTWGSNVNKQLGLGVSSNALFQSYPQMIPASLFDKFVIRISCFADTVLALTFDGTVYAWGLNSSGQAGVGSFNSTVSTPTLVQGSLAGKVVVSIAAGVFHSLAVTSDGELHAWGSNSKFSLGTGYGQPSTTAPVLAYSGVLKFVQVAAGESHSLALTTTGQVFAWGENIHGELGTASSPVVTPTRVTTFPSGTPPIKMIRAGSSISFAIDVGGKGYSWGSNKLGNLGIGSLDQNVHNVPKMLVIPSGFNLTDIASGKMSTIAVDAANNVYTWGINTDGQLAKGNNIGTVSPGSSLYFPICSQWMDEGAPPVVLTGSFDRNSKVNIDVSFVVNDYLRTANYVISKTTIDPLAISCSSVNDSSHMDTIAGSHAIEIQNIDGCHYTYRYSMTFDDIFASSDWTLDTSSQTSLISSITINTAYYITKDDAYTLNDCSVIVFSATARVSMGLNTYSDSSFTSSDKSMSILIQRVYSEDGEVIVVIRINRINDQSSFSSIELLRDGDTSTFEAQSSTCDASSCILTFKRSISAILASEASSILGGYTISYDSVEFQSPSSGEVKFTMNFDVLENPDIITGTDLTSAITFLDQTFSSLKMTPYKSTDILNIVNTINQPTILPASIEIKYVEGFMCCALMPSTGGSVYTLLPPANDTIGAIFQGGCEIAVRGNDQGKNILFKAALNAVNPSLKSQPFTNKSYKLSFPINSVITSLVSEGAVVCRVELYSQLGGASRLIRSEVSTQGLYNLKANANNYVDIDDTGSLIGSNSQSKDHVSIASIITVSSIVGGGVLVAAIVFIIVGALWRKRRLTKKVLQDLSDEASV